LKRNVDKQLAHWDCIQVAFLGKFILGHKRTWFRH
jgi:hypothetical protein